MESTGPSGRFYKSRKSRPCDCCRKRKVACDMPRGPPCHRCYNKSLPCTFEKGPGERKRRRQEPAITPGQDDDDATMIDHHASLHGESISFPEDLSLPDGSSLLLHDLALPDAGHLSHSGFGLPRDDESFVPAALTSPQPSQTSASRQSVTSPSSISDPLSTEASLELVPDAFSFYIGPTGAADVHLLAREDFGPNNVTRPRIPGLKYRRLGYTSRDGALESHPTLFGITDQSLLSKAEPRADVETIEAAWSDLWKIIDVPTAWRLVKLYGRFVDPYFPILATHQIPPCAEELSNMPLALLSAMCASALPFVVYDEGLYSLLLHPPSSSQLYRICWLDISQNLHSPTLATLQACLLLQQRLPTNAYLSDTAFAWSLMSTAVAVAQTVGLHRDPMGWTSVPLWERKLRKRLWWAVWMMDRWFSLVRGMPSHIGHDDFDVTDLTPSAITDSLSPSPYTSTHLYHLVKLTHILADIQKTYYTVRTMNQTANDLQLSLDLARTPRTQLKAWLDALEPSIQLPPRGGSASSVDAQERGRFRGQSPKQQDLDGSASIYLSYIVTHMTLFRALLRPLEKWKDLTDTSDWPIRAETMYDGAKAVIRGSLVCVRDFVEFIESLRDPQWNAFWHSWSRPNFAIAGSFMVHLLHVTSTPNRVDLSLREEDTELRDLVKRWRVANRVSANGAAGARGLANLGLLRVETMLGRLLASE